MALKGAIKMAKEDKKAIEEFLTFNFDIRANEFINAVGYEIN